MHSFQTVPDIRIASGGTHDLAALITGLSTNMRVALVTDKGVRGLGLLDPAITSLEKAGYDVLIYDSVIADPPEEIIAEATKHITDFGAGLIIGFGGGSSLDTAKVVAHLCASDQPLSELYGVGLARGPKLPLMLIPTTAGTGSEVTNVAILTTGKTEKQGIVANALYADRVLLDASLTLGLPKMITAATGIDAMVHAIEAYTSLPQKNPLSDTLALSALAKLQGAIERVCTDGSDVEARNDMLIGFMLAGQAFSNAPCAAVHALAYPLGGFFHVPHGLANALVVVEVMQYNLPKAEKYYAEIARHLSLGDTGTDLINEMQRIKKATGAPMTLSEVDIPVDAIPMMAEDALTKTRLLINNPREMTLEAATRIYESIA
ncbi:MAG: iron-containing alcohol dehydrogenase [Kordiimonadaceae bacterium]|nr:iron-containing alcohol dehydrogenase [Kordiimonadaceae bacterium]